jgi:hypothetical protein
MLDLIRQAQFFEQPQHALRTRIVQVMNRNHRGTPPLGDLALALLLRRVSVLIFIGAAARNGVHAT